MTTVKKPRKSRKAPTLSATPSEQPLFTRDLVLLDDAPPASILQKNEFNKWRNATKSGDKTALDAIDMALVESSKEYEKFTRRLNRINKAVPVIEEPPFDGDAADYFVQQANEPPAKKVEPIWVSKLKLHVEEFNARYALILNVTKAVVMKSTPNENGRLEHVYLPLETFRNLYLNERIKTGEKITAKGEVVDIISTKANAWLEHHKCRKFIDGTVFEPSRYANGIEVKKQIYGNKLNLWQGYSVQPIQGERGALERIYYHIQSVICNDDDACIEYLLNWIARCLQYPEKTGRVAVALKGEKGCGKGTLGNFIKSIFGQHALQVINAKHLVGHFNGHLADCCFLFADEAFFAGNKEHENIQKGLITEPSIIIERKGIDAAPMPNRLKILMASNNDWIAPATKDERRYFVLNVSSEKRGDTDYFNALHRDINNPVIQSAFLFDMLHRDISKFNVGKVPDTAALKEQRAQSLDTFGQYWFDVLHRGVIFESQHNNHELQKWINEPSTDLIRAGYKQWCNDHKITQFGIVKPETIGRKLNEWYVKSRATMPMCSGENSKGEVLKTGSRPYTYVLGSQIEAIKAFCEFEKLNADKLLKNCE